MLPADPVDEYPKIGLDSANFGEDFSTPTMFPYDARKT
jgi:hypothetical protein